MNSKSRQREICDGDGKLKKGGGGILQESVNIYYLEYRQIGNGQMEYKAIRNPRREMNFIQSTNHIRTMSNRTVLLLPRFFRLFRFHVFFFFSKENRDNELARERANERQQKDIKISFFWSQRWFLHGVTRAYSNGLWIGFHSVVDIIFNIYNWRDLTSFNTFPHNICVWAHAPRTEQIGVKCFAYIAHNINRPQGVRRSRILIVVAIAVISIRARCFFILTLSHHPYCPFAVVIATLRCFSLSPFDENHNVTLMITNWS